MWKSALTLNIQQNNQWGDGIENIFTKVPHGKN
jgi:hypothetical protein